MERKTPLYEEHAALGGKLVPFAGYWLPVQYPTGVIREHLAVRNQCGLFDVSHMGEVIYRGKDALANLQRLLTNDFASLTDGRVRYSPMCNPAGGVVDDLIVYRLNAEAYWVVVNAANRSKDVAWMRENLFGDCTLEDVSDTVAQLALQGPRARAILGKIARAEDMPGKYYTFVPQGLAAGIPCLISQTGYTGEDGFELYCSPADAPALWRALLAAGAEEGLIPCGLGARDTLRLEAAMPLYGHEMDEGITPLEAGLGWAVKMDKPDFIGRQALMDRGAPRKIRVGLEMVGRGIARERCPLYRGEEQVGITTSGTHCPSLGKAVAMALVEIARALPGTELEAEVRGRRIAVRVVPLPFYQRAKKLDIY